MADALALARRGWWVFPCRVRGKEPLTAHGFHDATDDVAVIEAWWRRWPAANIGLACGPSGLVVIDVDPRHGGDRSLARLRLPPTLVARTGGGGRHFFFAGHARSRKGPPGIDVKAAGGYVVAVGSVHPSGGRYVWEHRLPLAPWSENLVPITRPAPAVTRPTVAAGYGYGRAALRAELERLAGATEGYRNDRLHLAAFRMGQLVGAGALDPDETADALHQAGLGLGLPQGEVTATVASGLGAGRVRPRGAA
jgi:hypothetical protein